MNSFPLFRSLMMVIAVLNILIISPVPIKADQATAYMSQPNRDSGLERILGLGVVFPHPYFQKPRYRYPVYDKAGRGYPVYGYGGPETFQYKQFNRVDGHH